MGLFDGSNMLSFLVALAVIMLVLIFFGGRKERPVASRLQQVAGEWADSGYEEYENYSKKTQVSQTLERILGFIGIDPTEFEKDIKLKLEQAGIESSAGVINYVFAKKLGPFIGGFVALLILMGHYTGTMKLFAFGLAGYFLYMGFKGADAYLKSRKQKRQYVLQRSFPDALDLMLVCVEAGLAMDAALSRVCRELERAHPEITRELNKARIELTLLNDRPKALANLADRTDMVAFRAFTGALMQSEKFGTSLTETLRVLAEDYRNTRMMMAENKANRLPALMTIPLMLCMMPAFIMIIMGPAIIMLVQTWGSK